MRLPGSILQGILARAALAVLRIYLGIALIMSAGLKLEGEQGMLPGVTPTAVLIVWAELVVGTCLVLGLGTRLAGALAFLLSLNFVMTEKPGFWTGASAYPGWAVMSLTLVLGAAGRTFGLDAFLAKRWPRSPFW